MKITKIQTFLVNTGHRNVPFVKVHTDEGIHGVGEAYSCGPDKATAEVISDFEGWLIGRDPRDIEGLWQLMYAGSRFPGGMVLNAAISGIEHALWDIAGKAAGLPVYRLMGGKCRNKVRVYQSPHGNTPEELADNALKLIGTYGYTALKTFPFPPNWQAMPWPQALRQVDKRMAALSKQVKVPRATGEMLYPRHEFRDLLKLQAVNIIQPDICLTGGLWEMKKIAAMADAHYMTVAPHNPCGPIANAVNVHFAASTHNFLILEYIPDDSSTRRDIVDEPMKLVNGYLEIPEKPGLGIDLNEEACAKFPFAPWHRPFTWREDGSLAYQ